MFGFNHLFNLWRIQSILSKYLIISVLGLVVFAYLPTLQFDYVTQDQWRAFRYLSYEQSPVSRLEQCSLMISKFYILTGRPLVWPTECLEHAFVGQISDFRYLRPLALLIVVFTTIYIALLIEKYTFNMLSAFVVSGIFVTSPAYSFMYLQGWPALMVLISVVLAAASYKCFSELHNSKAGKHWSLIKSSILFLCGCMIYPAFAFIVLPLILMSFVSKSEFEITTRLKHLIISIFYYGLLSIIYYLFVKLVVLAIASSVERSLPALGQYEVSMQISPIVIIHRISEALVYFYMMPLFNFSTFRGATLDLLVAFSIFAGIGLSSINNSSNYSKIFINFLVIFFVTGIVLIASISPWITSQMASLSTRHLLPLYLFTGFAFIWVVRESFSSILRLNDQKISFISVLFILAPISIVQNSNSFLEVVSTRAEIEMIRMKINQWIRTEGEVNRFILVIRPERSRLTGVEDLIGNDIYGNDNAVLASAKNPVSISWMINAVFREKYKDQKLNIVDCGFDTESCVQLALLNQKNIVIAYAYGGGSPNQYPIVTPAKPYLINFSELTSEPIAPNIKVKAMETPAILATSTLDGYGPQGLFMSVSPGWHAEKNPKYPQSLIIDLKESKFFGSISFLPQEKGLINRAPKSVRIKISADGRSWNDAVNADDMCIPSSSADWYELNLPKKTKARYIKIEIMANCGDRDFLTLRGLRIE